MGVIKTVTNGARTATFKAVSLGHVVTMVFGLTSIIGAQQTWLWAGVHERNAIVKEMRADLAQSMSSHETTDSDRFDDMDRRLSSMERSMDDAQKQINLNTGRLDTAGAASKERR